MHIVQPDAMSWFQLRRLRNWPEAITGYEKAAHGIRVRAKLRNTAHTVSFPPVRHIGVSIMHIFFDESGNTGSDLLNKNQPLFALASTYLEDARHSG